METLFLSTILPGNIVFDFCFNFVYPLDLSYNNGTTVSVANLEELITVIINSNEDLFVNGIAFPFNVETYNEATDAIEVITINNEDAFIALIEDCDFDIPDCECYEVYEPVCVEIQDPNGVSFIVTFPNACYAECEGFTEEDFVENCEDDYNGNGGEDCFTFNFPITIITADGETITVNSYEELDNSLYDTYYFGFEFPFDVTTDDGEVVTITNEEDFQELLEDCYDNNDCFLEVEIIEELLMSCDTFEVEILNENGEIVDINHVNFNENGELIVNGVPTVVDSGSWNISVLDNELVLHMENLQTFTLLNGDWELTDCTNGYLEFFNGEYAISLECDYNENECDDDCEFIDGPAVCVEAEINGQMVVYTFPNACYAECEGYNSDDFINCENNTNCSEQEVFTHLLQCNWYLNTSLYDTFVAEFAQFSQDGTVTIFSEGSDEGLSGTWELASNPANGQVSISFSFDNPPHDAIAELDWTVVVCSEETILLESNNHYIELQRHCD